MLIYICIYVGESEIYVHLFREFSFYIFAYSLKNIH
jgi:hypothetical protein